MAERHMVRIAAYLVPIRKGRVLLLRRLNSGWEDGNYGLPSGHVEPGETASEAAAREAEEEAGIKASPLDLKFAHLIHRNAKGGDYEYVDVFFTADSWSGEPKIAEPDKCDHMDWFPLSNLPPNIVPSVRETLEHIQAGVFYSEQQEGVGS